ncbi:MAG TPA: pitrilysin family protein [Myxococcales bacterium]|nr:pitrilysin family protein [Myxococcales bacterium]
MSRHVLLVAGAALLFALPARAADPQIPFEKYQLPNGLTVVLAEDHRLPQVAVCILYHVGAANQTKGKSGFAHLFEHMMFSGAKHIGPAPFKVLESIGTTAGALANGTTNFDRTNYFEVVPSNELPTALWLESDRMAFLLDVLDDKKLSIQRDVVSNERRQSYENRPYGTAWLRMMDILFPQPHPYYDGVIGTIAEIQSASLEEIKAFFRRFYGVNNASLVLVGDFDSAVAKKVIEQYFGPIPRGPDVPVPPPQQPALPREIRETVNDKVAEVPKLTMAWTGVRAYSADEPAGDMLSLILGDGRTSRLYRSLVFDKKIASQVGAVNLGTRIAGYFTVDAVASSGHAADEMLPPVQAILDDIRRNGVTAAELERAKRKYLASRLREVERMGGFGGKADLLNAYETYTGDPGFLPRDLERYRAVTPEAVKAFAQKYLPDDHRLILTIVPAGGAAGGAMP